MKERIRCETVVSKQQNPVDGWRYDVEVWGDPIQPAERSKNVETRRLHGSVDNLIADGMQRSKEGTPKDATDREKEI